jgi:hypothetical protein
MLGSCGLWTDRTNLLLKLLIVSLLILTIRIISPSLDSARSVVGLDSSAQNPRQSKSSVPASGVDKSEAGPQCETTGTQEITITCAYPSTHHATSDSKNAVGIALNRAKLSFETNHESYMLVELEFTNEGGSRIFPAPTVYLAIDDDKGRNLVRRVLTKLDLSKIRPGERLAFSDRLLVGAFPAGRYAISLSIPNSDSSLKDNPANNILFSSAGVADPATGLNIIAHFSVSESNPSSRSQ